LYRNNTTDQDSVCTLEVLQPVQSLPILRRSGSSKVIDVTVRSSPRKDRHPQAKNKPSSICYPESTVKVREQDRAGANPIGATNLERVSRNGSTYESFGNHGKSHHRQHVEGPHSNTISVIEYTPPPRLFRRTNSLDQSNNSSHHSNSTNDENLNSTTDKTLSIDRANRRQRSPRKTGQAAATRFRRSRSYNEDDLADGKNCLVTDSLQFQRPTVTTTNMSGISLRSRSSDTDLPTLAKTWQSKHSSTKESELSQSYKRPHIVSCSSIGSSTAATSTEFSSATESSHLPYTHDVVKGLGCITMEQQHRDSMWMESKLTEASGDSLSCLFQQSNQFLSFTDAKAIDTTKKSEIAIEIDPMNNESILLCGNDSLCLYSSNLKN
jgi:hypothetical protein